MISKFLFPAIIIFIFAYLTGCSCSTCGQKPQTEIPDNVRTAADNFIISNTGKEFFNNYITIDLRRTVHNPPFYHLAYRLIIPAKPYVNELIEFVMDDKGNVNREFDIKGIPDCLSGEHNCEFDIDENKAIEIARSADLEEGIKEWKTAFNWSSKHNKYVWHILSTLEESEGSQGMRGSGKEVIIDPNSGEVIEINEWFVR
jgi:hypothetical protein